MVILVDSKGTHNSLDQAIVLKAKLPKLPTEAIAIKIANDKIITSEGKCPAVSMKVQGNTFFT